MIPHPFKPDPHGRDVCDQKVDEDGQIRLCGQRRGEHMDEVHGLKVQLATALRERDEARKACAEMRRERDDYKEAHRHANETITVVFENRVKKAEKERDSLRTTLTDIISLCMDVADTPDWRKKVGDKARAALHGEPGWERK